MASRVEEASATGSAPLELFMSGPRGAPADAAAGDGAASRRARGSADCGPVLLWTATIEQRRDWLNSSWESCTGRPVEQVLDRGWLDCIHPEDVERCQGIFAASCDARRAYTLDFRLRHHDGHYRWMMENGVPRFDPAGQLAGYFGTVVDIHERKRLEEQLAERMRTLRLAERRQTEFLSMLAHELRNPLAPIANAASVLRTLEEREPIVERLREILERQVHRLERLIADLADATCSNPRQISLVTERLDIESVVRGALEASATEREETGHRFDLRFPEGPLLVKGDRARLIQALVNVLANVDRSARQPGEISISAREAGARAEIVVRDPAHGIAADLLPHVFDPFAQPDAANERAGPVAALALARRILRLHGGELEARSEGPGRGACFVLSLPRVDGTRPPVSASESSTDVPAFRVLIVTRDAAAAEGLRRPLERWGHAVQLVGDAAAAGRASAGFRPHIVLCDVSSEASQGPRLVEALRETLDGDVFIAALGAGHDEDEARALGAGYDAFLGQPVHPGTLERLLHAFAGRAR